jgi:hypothetical protein
MPNHNTFTIKPIKEFVERYVNGAEVVIDPFARNATYGGEFTNDLNPDTDAKHHMPSKDFLRYLVERDVKADLVLFDPPYNKNQAKQMYADFGSDAWDNEDAWALWRTEKDLINQLLRVGGRFLHFGWHTNGMGKARHCQIEEILIVAHGGPHYDTLCMSERKVAHQMTFEEII